METVTNVLAVAGLASGGYGAVEAGRNGMYARAAIGAILLAAGAYRLLGGRSAQGKSEGSISPEGGNGSSGRLLLADQADLAYREYGHVAWRVWNKIAYLGKIVAVDLYAAVVGQVGEVWTFGQDLYDIGRSLLRGSFLEAGEGLLSTAFHLLVPNYGYYGGAGWGTRQFPDGVPPPLNRTDEASYVHDKFFRHLQWVRDVWTGPGLPPGPIGLAYNTLGTPFFSLGGGLQQLGILP
jgi:hypothetical protein